MAIDYGYDRLEHVTVTITEQEYKAIIAKYAVVKVQDDGKVDPQDWGCHVELKSRLINNGTEEIHWAEVEFHRRVPE